jgi:lysophospholipid acyltransferase (LPLAT)-like uncharacterized protein
MFMRQLLRGLAVRGGVPAVVWLLRALRWTWRVDRRDATRFFIQPVIIAFWHGDLLVGATEVMATKRTDFGTLVSRSRDGDIAAALAQSVGVTPIRGGSSRGQVEALRAMERWLMRGKSLVVAVDGPRGPRGIVKSGVVLLASRTGVPIVPAAALPLDQRCWRTRSWDGMWIPKPGAKLECIFGEPMRLRAHLSRDEIEQHRAELERRLFQLHGEQQATS